jgi:hypothetical protein
MLIDLSLFFEASSSIFVLNKFTPDARADSPIGHGIKTVRILDLTVANAWLQFLEIIRKATVEVERPRPLRHILPMSEPSAVSKNLPR